MGIIDVPVLVALSGEDWAGVATPHDDDDVSGPDRLVSPGLGELPRNVDPRSCIAPMAIGLMLSAGVVPPDQAMAVSPASASKNPSAIWERPALWVQRNSTTALPSLW